MSTPILPFAVWASGSNQASIPSNDNSLRNQILNGLVIDDATTAQPGSPSDGDIYILAATHTGAQWASFDEDDLVIFSDGTWYAFAPVDGVVVNFDDEQKQFTTGGGWATLGGGASAVKVIQVACSDETTALTVGADKIKFRMPYAMTLTAVRASLSTAQATNGGGGIFTVDINEAGASILSTKLTIDNTEKTSTTAATAAVISDSALADDAEITIDIDQIGDGTAKGLKGTLIGT